MARIGIDVGGTFTDAALVESDGRLRIAKVGSTPARIADGFMRGLAELLRQAEGGPAEIEYLAHGTTVATNALVQRRFARTALITNEGFRDVLTIGTQMRRHVYDLWTPESEPVVPRELCLAIGGRIGANGELVEELDEASVRDAARQLRAESVEAVAVMLLFSFLDASHEERVGEILAEELPGVPVALSSRVAPEVREYIRASTTAVNAALLPLVGTYIGGLDEQVRAAGVSVPLHLMQSNGGITDVARARELPIALAASGPAAGVIAGARLAAALGEGDVLTFDMGGTTSDVGLVLAGEPQLRFAGEADGTPINVPQIDVLCIGAGGGSIASVDRFGALTVGPASAGAYPGPAAYGAGGVEATVTDAHLVLGTLAPLSSLADSTLSLDRELAVEAVRRSVAEPLSLGVEEAADAILRIANANMAGALRVMSIARGHDPRRFALVAIGGAGPMHACALADDVGIPRVVVPRYPGVAAALGLLVSDIRHDLRRSWPRATATIQPEELGAELDRLREEGEALLGSANAVTGAAEFTYELDMRYRGQAYNLTVPLQPAPVTRASIEAVEAAFAEQHLRLYDYTPTVTETEIVTLRLSAIARVPATEWVVDASDDRTSDATAIRQVWSGGWREWRELRRAELVSGTELAAETVIVQADSTVLVPPGWHGSVKADGTILLERSEP